MMASKIKEVLDLYKKWTNNQVGGIRGNREIYLQRKAITAAILLGILGFSMFGYGAVEHSKKSRALESRIEAVAVQTIAIEERAQALEETEKRVEALEKRLEAIEKLNKRVDALEKYNATQAIGVGSKAKAVKMVTPKNVVLDYDTYTITFYCACTKCCGKSDGITASGAKVQEGVTVAAPKNIPFGTRLYIEGVGERVVQDIGGKIKGNKLDVYVSSHKRALQLGTFTANVRVIK